MRGDQTTQKIKELFNFLKRHHEFNCLIQHGYIKQTLSACHSPRERMRLLLERAVNTQSKPRLDKVAAFWKAIHESKDHLDSYGGFCAFVSRKSHTDLISALASQDGWGNKTASLFVRNLWIAYCDKELKSLIWSDLDLTHERLYLPVDAVIQNIFSQIDASKKWDFQSINQKLNPNSEKPHYSNEQMLIWDDLWFWGFITQRSVPGSKVREFEWNEAKYWSIFTAPRDKRSIEKIKALAERFVNLIKSV